MGMADIAEVLWNDFLSHNPANPEWINRDRFVLSNGHGCMLLYSLLHLSGYNLSIDDLKQFRQLNSKTPGHPEFGITPGVDATTGPLGQGIGMAVGMALAEKLLANTFNRDTFNLIDHYTYCFIGDGCLMEGISHEVCSLAGTLGLNKLIVFWDKNHISIDGKTTNWFNDNTPQRFSAYNWHVIDNVDGHDPKSISSAILAAQQESLRPSLLCCKTTIGYGSPNLANDATIHGSPLGKEEVLATRKKLNWDYPAFTIPTEIYQHWDAKEHGKQLNAAWDQQLQHYRAKHPDLYLEYHRRINNILPSNWPDAINKLLGQQANNDQQLATRSCSKIILDNISGYLPELFGGSADLSQSNQTLHNNAISFDRSNHVFNYLHYGVREFGMGAIMNGMALHKGFIPYGGTFLVFSDYARSAIRTSALMQQKIIYVLSHDSIGLGEDGPTHQPVEHLAMLRATPNLSVWRPGDIDETIIAWQDALENNSTNPVCLVLSRQKLTKQPKALQTTSKIKYGGYILFEPNDPQAIIIATGSEIALAMQAASELQEKIKVRVVSMPNVNLFLQQPTAYQAQVLPNKIKNRVAVEAGSTLMWHKFVGLNGAVIGIDCFGSSAPGAQLYAKFNITKDSIIHAVLKLQEQIYDNKSCN
jgi:transketolase